jgi:hypothetical protein
MIVQEIKRLRAEGWPPIASIAGPQWVRPGRYRIELRDATGELVGEPFEFEAQDANAATAIVAAALKQLRR